MSDQTFEARRQSPGQEWTPWAVEKAGASIEDVFILPARMKVTLHLDTGQKVQWRRKP